MNDPNFEAHASWATLAMIDPSGDWQKSWREFFLPSLSVAAFIAEAREAFIETFPETAQLLSVRERQLITNQLLYQLSYAGIYLGKYSLMRLPRIAFYTPFLYGEVRRF